MAPLPPLRFSVCVEMLFKDKPFEQRLEYVADHLLNAGSTR